MRSFSKSEILDMSEGLPKDLTPGEARQILASDASNLGPDIRTRLVTIAMGGTDPAAA